MLHSDGSPGTTTLDFAYYGGSGPEFFDVQFYNFELDLGSQGFLFSYNSFNDGTPFYIPPPPPNFIQDPSEGVEGIYGSGSTPGAQEAGEYIDLPDFLNRTGGMIDFDGDGDVGLGDFLALHCWLMNGAYADYGNTAGQQWPAAGNICSVRYWVVSLLQQSTGHGKPSHVQH